jgi:transglutaminase-like putative cysteine protease
MIVYKITTDGKASSTGAIMRKVVETYYRDMAPYASLPLIEIFNLIKSLPYRPDPVDVETIMRPSYTMGNRGHGGDCDCKAVALASWLRLHRRPFRFVAIRRPGRDFLHHVALETLLDGKWLFADPTYKFNNIGQEKEYIEKVVL